MSRQQTSRSADRETSSPNIILGLWPIAGITSVGVEDAQSVATVHAALDAGVRWFDTAYAYGYSGRSDRVLAEAVRGVKRESVGIISKVGQYWTSTKERRASNDPDVLRRHFDELLGRLETDYVDLLMLHQIDSSRDLEQTAAFFAEVKEAGRARSVGICNATVDQVAMFQRIAGCAATQFGFNMLQQQDSGPLRRFCQAEAIAGQAYWVLMKGILAGKISRDHEFASGDSRPRYSIYQGKTREAVHDLVDQLRVIARELEITVAQLVIAWTLRQEGIQSVVVGAKRPDQIEETAAAGQIELPDAVLARIASLERPEV